MKNVFAKLILVCGLGAFVSACGPSPDQAQQQIQDLGYRYDTDGLIQALEEHNKRIILRFLIADQEHTIIREVLYLMSACDDREYDLADECLQHVRLLAGYDIDLNLKNEDGDGMVWFAAQAGNEHMVDYLMREDIAVGDRSVIDRAKELEKTDFNQPRRERRKRAVATIEARWNVNAVRGQRGEGDKLRGTYFQSSSQ